MAFWNLIAKISADSTGFQVGVKQAESVAAKFGSGALASLKGQIAGMFGVGAITAFTKQVIDLADEIGDLADQTGFTVEEIQKLKTLSLTRGLEAGEGIAALNKLAQARQDAIKGNIELQDTFNAIGLSMEKVKSLSDRIDFGAAVGKGLKDFSATDRSVLLRQLGGRGGAKMGEFFEALNYPIAGNTMSKETVDKLSAYKDDFALGAQNLRKKVAEMISGIALANPWIPRFGEKPIPALVEATERKRPTPSIDSITAAAEARKRDAKDFERAKEVAKEEKALAETVFQIELKRASEAEKRLMIQKKLNELESERRAAMEFDDPAGALRTQAEMEKLFDSLRENVNQKPETTALQRVGALGGGDGLVNTVREQLTVQKRMASDINKLASSDGGNQFS